MSNNSKKVTNSEERTDAIIGIITVVVVLALLAWMFVSISRNANAISPLEHTGQATRGSEQVFTAQVKSPKIKDGAKVQWIVNGEVVNEDTYHTDSDEPLTFNYSPTTSGQNCVTVKVGKYSKTAYLDVTPPTLTISAPNIVITYGDKLPDFAAQYDGFVQDDCCDDMDYDGMCYLCNVNNERLTCDKLNAGVYSLNMDQNCCYKDYNVNYVGGTLTVLPKKLSANGNFVKTYDSTNIIENPNITLDGIIDGDDVSAQCDKLYFDNKNAGKNKNIMLANVELTGQDKCNYELCGEAHGDILPKQVEISGLTIRDKMYDGTTKAQIDKMGALNGIITGDSVAIGNLQLSFAEAEAGEQQIVLDDVTLVGADKDNYQVIGVDVESASINTTIWNKIFVKNPAITAGAE